jgi:2-C-methyl-D-erythritol 2,4-cyclodiphosphate synthase
VTPVRTGFGWDLHRLAAGRRLVLGGVEIPSDRGEEGFSDGDVLTHALIDALLGAACLGDIGRHFAPGDPRWKGISSRLLLARAREMIAAAGWRTANVDCIVVLEQPRISPYADDVRATLAADLGIPLDAVSVKSKTAEGLGDVGAGRAVEAFATVLLERIS